MCLSLSFVCNIHELEKKTIKKIKQILYGRVIKKKKKRFHHMKKRVKLIFRLYFLTSLIYVCNET